MDLAAYVQIGELSHLLIENKIGVPRLRGLRLMSDEEPLSEEKIEEMATELGLYECENCCRSNFIINACGFEYSSNTEKLIKKYIISDSKGCAVGINWKAIHGYKRKVVKYTLKTTNKAVREQFAVFNRYAGRNDVLYIHARIGGRNWGTYRKDVENEPWFLEKVDDAYDSTYCDIYAKIDPSTV